MPYEYAILVIFIIILIWIATTKVHKCEGCLSHPDLQTKKESLHIYEGEHEDHIHFYDDSPTFSRKI